MRRLAWILTAALVASCASAPAPRVIAPPRPPLDQSLAAPCVLPPAPLDLADYDAVDGWMMHQVLPAFADCARRLAAVVQAWQAPADQRNGQDRNER